MRLMEFIKGYLTDASEVPVSHTVVAESAATAYFKACALNTAISYRASAIGMSEFTVYEKGVEKREDLWYLLNYSPNQNQSASQFWNKFVRKLVLENEALIVPIGSRLYVADSFSTEQHALGHDVFTGVAVGEASVRQSFKASRAMYFRLDDANVAHMVDGALEAYADMMAKAMHEYKRSCGTKYKVVLERRATGDGKAVEQQQKMLSGNLKTFMENASAVYMETNGQRLEPVKSDSSVEPSHITDLRREIYDSVAVTMKIPKSIMYGDMTNIGDIVNVMLTFAVDPTAKMVAQEITRKNYSPEEVKAGSRVTVDTSTVKHTDLFDSAKSINSLIGSGVCTIDDILKALGKEPERSDFTSQRWMAQNIGRIEDVMNPENSAEGGEQIA